LYANISREEVNKDEMEFEMDYQNIEESERENGSRAIRTGGRKFGYDLYRIKYT
jgi:hypothetical protein